MCELLSEGDKSCWYAVQLSWPYYLTMVSRLGRPWIQGFLLQIKTLFFSTFWKPLGYPAFSSKHTNLSFTWSQRIGMKTNHANIFSPPDSRLVGTVIHSSTFPLWISQPAKSQPLGGSYLYGVCLVWSSLSECHVTVRSSLGSDMLTVWLSSILKWHPAYCFLHSLWPLLFHLLTRTLLTP